MTERWSLEAFGIRPEDGPTKFRIVADDGRTIGFTYGYSQLDAANGAMMAAGPELLTACKEAFGVLDALIGIVDQGGATETEPLLRLAYRVLTKVHEATAKATRGEQP